MFRKTLLAVATSLGVAIGSFGAATAPAAAAMTSAPVVSSEIVGTQAIQVKHRHWHHKKRHWHCRTVWVGKKVWRHHHWVWIKVPVRKCGWGWRW
jgi:hypothetical protein